MGEQFPSNNPESISNGTKYGLAGKDNDGFLDGGASHVGFLVSEIGCLDLTVTGDPKQRRWIRRRGNEVEVRIVFRCQMRTVGKSEERENVGYLFVFEYFTSTELDLRAHLTAR